LSAVPSHALICNEERFLLVLSTPFSPFEHHGLRGGWIFHFDLVIGAFHVISSLVVVEAGFGGGAR